MAFQMTDNSSNSAIGIESDGTFSQIGLTKFYAGIICQAIKDACEPVGAKELRPLLHRCPLETHMTSGLDAVFFLFMTARDEKHGTRFEKYMIELDRDPGTSRRKLMMYGDVSGSKSKCRRNPSAVNLRKRLRFLRDQIRRSEINANKVIDLVESGGANPQQLLLMDDLFDVEIGTLIPGSVQLNRPFHGELRA